MLRLNTVYLDDMKAAESAPMTALLGLDNLVIAAARIVGMHKRVAMALRPLILEVITNGRTEAVFACTDMADAIEWGRMCTDDSTLVLRLNPSVWAGWNKACRGKVIHFIAAKRG